MKMNAKFSDTVRKARTERGYIKGKVTKMIATVGCLWQKVHSGDRSFCYGTCTRPILIPSMDIK